MNNINDIFEKLKGLDLKKEIDTKKNSIPIVVFFIVLVFFIVIFMFGDSNYKFKLFPNTFYSYKKNATEITIETFKKTGTDYVNFDPDHNELIVVFDDGYTEYVSCKSPIYISFASLFFTLNDKDELLYSKSGVGGEEYNIDKDEFFEKFELMLNGCINTAYNKKVLIKKSNDSWNKE
jgi:hypothetical protein